MEVSGQLYSWEKTPSLRGPQSRSGRGDE